MSSGTFLETQRLYLRLFGEDDVQNLFRIEGSAEVMAYIRKPVTEPAKSLERIRQEAVYATEYEGLGLFACFEKAADTYIGLVKIKHIDDTDDIEIGYGFVPEAWGKGYATEITQKVIEYLKLNFTGRKIIAFVQEENTASKHVLEKVGMTKVDTAYEGRADAVVFELR
ncbi:GNAT family N-acetyltransferase [Runella slithyformis]|uniref:GCN5-related N-acetyltransferase n=1 Tax=Runella slithyformis (strain ATCC 29530 / DSM 19594 / LMG 11500 / NCIMB 11436 / LSU 4) TaxID=761193 RepID=A0A7U3ZH94_RUNSL|nr:GNAT family N-acetyltransferase [Runella slithyformis]AEI47181.1 GCN5-related N-acetyltransferase [Runella slithyformis DSM 19594]